MKKLDQLNRPYENISDPEKRERMDNLTLCYAYQKNLETIERKINKLTKATNESEDLKSLQIQQNIYQTAIDEKRELLKDVMDKFTKRDRNIAELVSCCNTDDASCYEVNFGTPYRKTENDREDKLLCFSEVAQALEGHLRNNKKKDIEYWNKYKFALNRFIRGNLGVNNNGISWEKSYIFNDETALKIDDRLARYLAAYAIIDIRKNAFTTKNFYGSLCAWLYIATTKGNKFNLRYTFPLQKRDDMPTYPMKSFYKPL